MGRTPLSTGLGLEALGVELNRGYIKIDEQMRTANDAIYAIGDVNGPPLLAHAASEEAGLIDVAENEVGVRDRRPGASVAVAGWTRNRTRALRTDAERTAVVDPRNRAAARTDRVDVEHRRCDPVAADPRIRPARRVGLILR